MKAKQVGQAGLVGWREKAAGAVAPPVAERTALDEETVRSVVGALFFVLALVYVAGTVRRILSD